jgi:hypothetical protein
VNLGELAIGGEEEIELRLQIGLRRGAARVR